MYLFRLSDEKFLSFPYKEVPDCWRRLYTDASLLEAICRTSREPSNEEEALTAIAKLDMALIVAGAPGTDRSGLIHALIAHIQSRLTSSRTPSGPTKRRKVQKVVEVPPVDRPILRLEMAPSLGEYLRHYIEKPFIISGGAKGWPAMQERAWASPSYLERVAGPGRIVPVEVGGTYTMATWSQRMLPFDRFLGTIGLAEQSEQDDEIYYLAQHDLFRQLPTLQDDIVVPDYLYSGPPGPSDMPDYTPPATDSGYILNAWLGPAGTNSPPHTDPYFNCFAQVVGKKWIWLAPPSATPAMYAFGDGEDGGSISYMTNTSQVDVSRRLTEAERERWSRFVNEVEPAAMQSVLEPGDMLVMPPGWWHSLKSLDTSFSVSMWY